MPNEFILDQPKLIISIDAELAWGSHNLKTLFKERISSSRSSWIKILDLFDRYEIPATWAIVGHLFLNRCDGVHKGHSAGKDWFHRDPGGVIDENPNWFGIDLINQILEAEMNHEIGCHSFSHVEFDSAKRDVVESELQHCLEAAKKMNVDLKSFVFPKNKIGYQNLLKKYGFTCYRGLKPPSWYDKISLQRRGVITENIRKGSKFLDFTVIRTKPIIVNPIIDEFGLINIPASLKVFSFEGKAREISDKLFGDPVWFKIKKGINFITKNKGILHLWFHPNDLTQEKDFKRLVKILRFINKKKKETDLEVKTMKDVAEKVRV